MYFHGITKAYNRLMSSSDCFCCCINLQGRHSFRSITVDGGKH